LASITSPFYEFKLFLLRGFSSDENPPIQDSIEYLWTYKLRVEDIHHIRAAEEYWFDSYWSRDYSSRSTYLIYIFYDPSLVFPSMFFAQIAVVAVTVASVIRRSKILAFVPIAACSFIIVLMTFAHATILSTQGSGNGFQMGYWYTCCALILFSARFSAFNRNHT
jgi:hypothetical protein